ncbi:MAG: restriction endonuclease subunit S [Syntrophorhabdaceae bacterium]|nr:restriction endonuclease subunit S [Syntrophorhabdaceae bacterium]
MKQNHKFKETEIGMIPEDWEVKPAEGFCERVTDGTHATPEKRDEGNYLITSRHLKEGHLDFDNAYFISTSDFNEINKRSRVDQWDIIFSMIGTVGEVYLEKSNKIEYAIKNVGLFKSGNELYGKWLFFFLKSRLANEYIRKNRSGTTQEYITLGSLRKFPIAYPRNTTEMQEIVSHLDSLQNKIELNQQMSATLEKIGQAIFKHWFIDFEFPDEKGRPYKSSGGEMVDSELGEIPKGWEVGCLRDICDITMGQSPPGQYYNERGEGLPFYQGVVDFGFRFPARRVYCTQANRFAKKDDVLLSVRAPVGRLNVAVEKCSIGRGVAALRLKEEHSGLLYYLLCATQSGWDKFEAEGTVFGSANKSDVNQFKIVIPPEPLRVLFVSLINPIDEAIKNNDRQLRVLSQTRDSLLPRLMSGKIRVNAEASQ